VAVVGCGYWGKNLVRVLSELPGCDLRWACDISDERRHRVRERHPEVPTVDDIARVLEDSSVEAVVLATSAATHAELARRVIAAGKHLYVEKPLATTLADAEAVVAAVEDAGLTLMVGHLLLYHPAVRLLRSLLDDGELGEPQYMYCQRVNLGVVRQDENALWSLAPHDVSVMNHLLGGVPESVAARGHAYLQDGVEDVVFVNLRYPSGRMGQIQVSWLDPHKVRRMTIVGSRKMAVFDDVQPSEKVRVYDKGAEISQDYATFGEYMGLRHGDVVIPRLPSIEPLLVEAQHFLDCVREERQPDTDGRDGLDVVRVLEAASRSLAQDGVPVEVTGAPF
jgi:predicted dehydrogenase